MPSFSHKWRWPLGLLLWSILAFIPTMAISKPLEGVGELKFGMTPEVVQSLPGCSSGDECLYELLGKNRYFTLSYDLQDPSSLHATSTPARSLRSIDVDMGNYTSEWFLEIFEVLQSQYPIVHSPTEEEDALFQQQKNSELVIGFADGHVLLKVIRRAFGNLILGVVFQDASSATHTRQMWALSPAPQISSTP